MKSMVKTILGLGVAAFILSACADHSFSPVDDQRGSAEPQPEEPMEPPPVEPEEPPPVDPPPAPVGPSLVWVQVPAKTGATHDPVPVVYKVIPGSSPVVSIKCLLNNIAIACDKDGDSLDLSRTVAGNYELQVSVTDKNNLKDSDKVSWSLFDKFEKVQQKLAVENKDSQVDVLFVMDNSNSMREEQANMADRITSFMDRVKGMDWRIAIVTTDMVDTVKGDGRLLKFENNVYYLTSSMTDSKARSLFAKTIQTGVNGDSQEQGIKATYRSIERAVNGKETNDKYNKEFFRANAALSVIVVSDENESGKGTKNIPSELIKLVQNTWSSEKIFKFHSIIARPGDSSCSGKLDQSAGVAYKTLTDLTGGVLGNVCAADYGTQLSVIGQDVLNSQTTYDLDCIPADTDGDGFPNVKVSSGLPNFQVSGKKIIFSKPPVKGDYSIEYSCPK